MDLIDRETAYKVLTKYYHHSTDIQHEALREALSRVPSAEKKGEWHIYYGEKIYAGFAVKTIYCSNCGMVSVSKTNYCPHCGARMEI